MALKTFVKISNVNNLSDARYCAGMYVNLMGFSLEEGDEYYVSPSEFAEITEWLSGLHYVAEFNMSHPDQILEALQQYRGFDYIQVNEKFHLQLLYNSGYGLIYNQVIKEDKDWDELQTLSVSLKKHNVMLNLEADAARELQPDEKKHLQELSKNCDVLLGFGFDAENVEQILDQTGVRGISMKGGHEISPGIKDFDELADILEVLELED
ncbi:phosphoribosylanthranilate isomerase [Cyclobacterium lianum]|uniref:phosphoribosylanthranilate isomerase n=1 Tax=Cyclobacterium lianum TaxID=388280 RepID=A0A1M7M528_9BACT|nr:phosphoribosylanthranilate isomerase [Cyclobacterium lianum]SHM85787.1 phosphoribosylanthranilate isomerase [Cyclobacterium lianum]